MSCQVEKMRTSPLVLEQVPQEDIVDLELPQEVHLALQRGWVVQVKKGKAVLRGEILATPPVQGLPHLVSPVAGKVKTVAPDFIEIKTDKDDESIEPVDINSLEKEELLNQLSIFGFDTRSLLPSKTLVVNGLEPEPTIAVHGQLLRDEQKVLAAGLDLVKKIICPSSVVLALPQNSNACLDGCENFFCSPVYPSCMDELVLTTVCGESDLSEASIMSLSRLHALGRIAETGLPRTQVVLTVASKNYRLAFGTPVQDVLNAAGIEIYPENQVVLGGPFRGQCAFSPAQGIRPDDLALTVVSGGNFPATQDVACLNCGECVLACPVGLMSNLIARYAEYNLFEQTLKYHVHSCIECGMCSYSCMMQRPVLQYIQLAKAELRKADLPSFIG